MIADDPAVGGARLLVRVSGPGRRRHRRRPRLLGLADHLRRPQRRRDLGGHRRLRQQGRAGHADRGDPRRPAARRGDGAQRARACCAPPARWPARSPCPASRRARAACSPAPPRASTARCSRPRPARSAAIRRRSCVPGRRGGGVAVHRRRLDRRGRHGRLPRRRPGLRLRPRARRPRPARAVPPGRLRVRRDRQPARRARPGRDDLQAHLVRRPPARRVTNDTFSAIAGHASAPARPRSRCA